MTRIKLNEDDFRALVRGKVVQKDAIEIALDDIGFGLMLNALNVAMTEDAIGPVCECSHPQSAHREVWGLGGVQKFRCTTGACSCADFNEAPR